MGNGKIWRRLLQYCRTMLAKACGGENALTNPRIHSIYRHMQQEAQDIIARDSSNLSAKWWLAISVGFSAVKLGSKGKQADVIRRLVSLKQSQSMELASIVSLIFFYSSGSTVDFAKVAPLQVSHTNIKITSNLTHKPLLG